MSDLKSRSDLKEKFKKGKTPSQEDFQDLINASFNQEDDRVRRPPSTPLLIDAEANGEVVRLKLGDKTFTLKLDQEGNLELKDHDVVIPGALQIGKLTLVQNKMKAAELADLELEAGKGKKLRTESNVRLNGLDVYTTPDKIGVQGWQELDVQLVAHEQKRLVLGPLPQAKDLKGRVCSDRIVVNNLDAAQQIEASTVSATEKVVGPVVEGTAKVTSPLVEGKEVRAGEKVVGPVVEGSKEVMAPVVNATEKVEGPTINATQKLCENGNPLIPEGMIMMWSGMVGKIPAGWVLCDGKNNTPDLRGKFIVGVGNEYKEKDQGGKNEVTLSEKEMPSHSHGVTDPGHSHSFYVYDGGSGMDVATWDNDDEKRRTNYTNRAYTSISIQSTGESQPHENRPPYYALCFIMKT